MKINLGWLFLRRRGLRKSCYISLSCLKNLDKGPVPRIELSPEDMVGCGGETQFRDQSPLCVPAIICLPNIYFSSSRELPSSPFKSQTIAISSLAEGGVNYKLAFTKSVANDWTTGHFPICLYRDWTPSCYSCWLSRTPDKIWKPVFSVLQGNTKSVSMECVV